MINVVDKIKELKDYWSPIIIGEMNDNYIKLAKLKGDFVWHDHKNSDEVFYIVKGTLIMEYEDKKVYLKEGDMHVVKKGVMHNPIAEEDCYVMLFESKETLHTGDVVTDKTKSIEDQKE